MLASTFSEVSLIPFRFPDSDLLKRHASKHDSAEENSGDGPSATKRRKTLPDVHRPRAQRACRPCAEAKARCEGDQPCLRCQQKDITCDYPPPRSRDISNHPEPTHTRLSQIQPNQAIESRPVLAQDQRPSSRTPAATSMDKSLGRYSNDQHDPISGHTVGFQLPTPSTFAPGKYSSTYKSNLSLTNAFRSSVGWSSRT